MLSAEHRCPAHARTVARQYKQHSSSIYNTKRWRILRRSVLADQGLCQTEGCRALAWHVDHVIPLRDGGAAWDRDNLQALCVGCHSRKTAHEIGLGHR
jgi:5-methylcytosine-specific restriction protein A